MKQTFIQQVTTIGTALAQSFETANSLLSTYFDRGYNSGGLAEFTPEELAAAGTTAAEIAAGITLFEQLQNLRNGLAVAVGDYDATLNRLRRDI